MKKILIVCVFLILAGCASKTDLESALSDNLDLESQVSQKNEIIHNLETQVGSLDEKLADLQDEINELSLEYTDIEEELADKNYDLLIAERDLSLHICNIQINDMKFDNILNISTFLAGWYAQLPGIQSVQGTYRDSIWNNTDTKIHSVNYTDASDHQQYVDHFLVYFDEFGWNPSIFWLSRQCWLDSPY